MKTIIVSAKNVEKFSYLGTVASNQILIQEEIKSRLYVLG
jgi:hypothetical protein